MKGVYINNRKDNGPCAPDGDVKLELITRFSGHDIMLQRIIPNSTIWISPADSPDIAEFFYVLSGELKLTLESGETTLKTGDSFTVNGMQRDLLVSATQPSVLLYISSCNMFEQLCTYKSDLEQLLDRIDRKDKVTLRHSLNTMAYATAIYNRLGDESLTVNYDNLMNAALFHDVGKCFLPDELLTSKKLTADERERIRRHAADGAKLTESVFGKRVAIIVNAHHEKSDGSGYPDGIQGNRIPIESRIITVANVYDSLTSGAGRHRVHTPAEAIEVIVSAQEKYWPQAVAALKAAFDAGDLEKIPECTQGRLP